MAKKTKQATKETVELLPEEIPPKDEEELHLEKLVFGDVDGFEQNLKQIENLYDDDDFDNEKENEYDNLFTYDDESDEELRDQFLDGLSKKDVNSINESNNEDEDEEEEGIEDVNDDQLFFHDDSGDDDEDKMDVDSDSDGESSDDEDEDENDSDAWIDSEDENLEITLVSSDKLKKLRKTETETSIKGKAYIQRLRTQFEKIYPRPEWADKFEEDEENNSNSDDNMDSDDEENNRLTTDVVKDQVKTFVKNSSNPLLEFLSTNQSYSNSNSNTKILPPNKIDISRLTDANHKHVSRSAIQSLHFHPHQPLLLTGGYDRSLRVYHIDGKINKMITSLFLKKSPIQSAYFNTGEGLDTEATQILSGGRRRYMYKWDINQGSIEKISRLYGHEQTQRSFENFKISPNGKYIALMGNSGWINLLDSKTSQWIKGFKIEGELVDFDISSHVKSPSLVAVNKNGDVWEWDIESEKILDRWSDQSGTGVTKIKIGGEKNNRWLAIGSNIGLVNVYDRLRNTNTKTKSGANTNTNTTKTPIGVIENLVTTISSIEFSNDGQLMCIASRDKKDALRLVHLPTCKTYSNWPTSGTPLGKVTKVCFSPNNEMLATGNEAGKVRLWKLNHY